MLVLSRAARAGGFGLRRGLLQCHARGLCGFDWSQFGPDDVERDPWLVLGVEPDASKGRLIELNCCTVSYIVMQQNRWFVFLHTYT